MSGDHLDSLRPPNLPGPGGPDWNSAISHKEMRTAFLQRHPISGPSSAPTTPRKRTHSFTMDTIPTLPKISGDMILEVFTHKSLRYPGGPMSEEFGDNLRLAKLGEKAANTAVTYALFCKKPLRTAEQLDEELVEVLSDANVDHWLTVYRLREKVRCNPNVVSNLKSPEEGRLLFNSYVGAVFVQSGMNAVQDWIGKLTDPPPTETSIFDMDSAKRFKNEPIPLTIPASHAFSPAATIFQAHQGQHISTPPLLTSPQIMGSQTMQPPPPSNPPPPLPNSVAPQSQPIAFLPLFNQTANQRRLGVEYKFNFFGPPHAGRWIVKCLVNGIEKGQGTGSSKQLAKEEAAKQAFHALGWAART